MSTKLNLEILKETQEDSKELLDLLKDSDINKEVLKRLYSSVKNKKESLVEKEYWTIQEIGSIGRYPKRKAQEIQKQVETINLATFAYHFILGQGLEEALDAFFVSILPFGCKIIKRDVQLYFKLRLELFLNESIERLKEDAGYDLLQLLNDHFPLDLSRYGPHLSEDDDNVMIVIESATIRKKIKTDLKRIVSEHVPQPRPLTDELLAYMRERIERLEHPEKFQENKPPLSFMDELPGARVLIEADFEEPWEPTCPLETERRQTRAIRMTHANNISLNEPTELNLRKERENWTAEEEEALEEGLREVKGPFWVTIKEHVHPKLVSRTNVQIKDKAHGEMKKRKREGLELGPFASLIP
ncbi:hypothetical protein G6F57_009004 [Rhizopus arrhizus]|nr:hypothetical protein G6F23_004954 [Rhizopus arrhizus]KAG1416492.1 hypothetical protein G6F58_005948 [Rhizopus delemar]KAG0755591.1 hypothetical protein G6F24_011730 [Rhizopus arrhizus]KAG0781724.1 hypothetical protein G6F21_011497 [Rhizopus arrhizus]KAG0809609.1 hypothetical protein G6F20_008647 [Rhizopus arrhizus]